MGWTFPNQLPQQPSKETLRERFRKVILKAGYQNPEPILEEWFEKYMDNVPEFVKMLEEYEASPDGDPD